MHTWTSTNRWHLHMIWQRAYILIPENVGVYMWSRDLRQVGVLQVIKTVANVSIHVSSQMATFSFLIATIFCCLNESFDFVGPCFSHQFVFNGSVLFLRTSCCVLWCWLNCSKTREFSDIHGYPKTVSHGFPYGFPMVSHGFPMVSPLGLPFLGSPWGAASEKAPDPGRHRYVQGESRTTLEWTDARTGFFCGVAVCWCDKLRWQVGGWCDYQRSKSAGLWK